MFLLPTSHGMRVFVLLTESRHQMQADLGGWDLSWCSWNRTAQPGTCSVTLLAWLRLHGCPDCAVIQVERAWRGRRATRAGHGRVPRNWAPEADFYGLLASDCHLADMILRL